MTQQTHHPIKASAKKKTAVKKTPTKKASAKKTPTKKPQTKKTPTKKAAAIKTTAVAKPKQQGTQAPTPEERRRMIAEVAYRIAEQRGFKGDRAQEDWLQAEEEVDARLAARH